MAKMLEGYYEAHDSFYRILKCTDGKVTVSDAAGNEYPMKIEYGDFGETDPEVEKRSGEKHYNVKLTISLVGDEEEAEETKKEEPEKVKKMEFSDLGVFYDGGRKCSMKGMAGVSGLVKITEDDLERIMNDFEPMEAPPGPYKVQPEKKGKIIWLTGAPGMGKSTSAQLLARNHGFVYYEADCFMALKNPYVPLNVDNPSMAQMYQKVLKGPGMEERQAMLKKTRNIFGDILAGKDYNKEQLLEYYGHMASDIAREKRRIGGDWAIAHVLVSADVRAFMREKLGSDLIIVVLTMSSSDRRHRILSRHKGDTNSADIMDQFEKVMEGVKENEPNTIELRVNSSMTRDEVVTKIFQKVRELTA